MNDPMRRVLRVRAEREHGQKLGAGVDGQPEPEYLLMAAEPCSEFVQLQVWEVQMAEGALVQGLLMFPLHE